jgi:hypothetical protein
MDICNIINIYIFWNISLGGKKMKTFRSRLIELRACRSAIRWLDEEGISTIEEAWDKCSRGDWLLWLAARVGCNEDRHKKIVKIATEIARQVLKYIPAEEERPRIAIEKTERWLDGKEKIENVITASDAAYAAATAHAHAADAAAAAAASVYASSSASDAAYAAAYADAAAYAAAAAASDAVYASYHAAAASSDAVYASYHAAAAAAYASDAAAARAHAAADAADAADAEIVRSNLSCPKLELEGEGEGGKK